MRGVKSIRVLICANTILYIELYFDGNYLNAGGIAVHGRKSPIWGSSPPIFVISVFYRNSPLENMQNSIEIESTIFSMKYLKFSPAAHI